MAKTCTTLDQAEDLILELMDEVSAIQDNDPKAEALKKMESLQLGLKSLAREMSATLYPLVIDMIKENAEDFMLTSYLGDVSTIFSGRVDTKRALAEAEERLINLSKYQETIERKSKVKKEVLKGFFGDNLYALSYFLRTVEKGIRSSKNDPTYDVPGFIDVFFTSRHRNKLVTLSDISENVRLFKLLLLDGIISFLQSKNKFNVDISLGEDLIFNNLGEYTGNLEKSSPIYKEISKAFNISSLAAGNYLDGLYRLFKKGDKRAKLELEAYNAWVLLNNFDTVLALQLQDDVVLNEPEKFNKIENLDYKTNVEKATNMWSFGIGDEVSDLGDLVSNITQRLIESSRRYVWKGGVVEDSYIRFKDFTYIIGKIKALAFSLLANDIVLDLDTSLGQDLLSEEVNENPLNKLTDTTKNILRKIEAINIENRETEFNGKPTLGLVIALMSENPVRHLHAIFDILCKTDYIDSRKIEFEDLDKNLIWSLYKEVFGHFDNNSRSLFDLHHNTKGDTIFPIITQIADSMFAEEIIQYYEDENGVLYALLLKDYSVQLLRNELQLQILSQNGYYTPKGVEEYLTDPESIEYLLNAPKHRPAKTFFKAYDIEINTTSQNIEFYVPKAQKRISTKILKSIEIPLFIDKNRIGSIIAQSDGVQLTCDNLNEKLWKSSKFKQLIKDAIGIDFESDTDLLAAYESTFLVGDNINYTALTLDIGKVLGTAIFNLAFNNEFAPAVLKENGLPRTLSSLSILVDKVYGDLASKNKIDPKTGLISIISNYNKNVLLKHLGEAKAIANNIFTAAQVKTGEGTALSLYCLSRLRNSYAYQLVTQNRNRWSASNFMSFVRNRNGLIKGVASSREVKSNKTVKTSTDMSGVETWSLNFYNDWVAAFVKNHRDKSPVGDGSAGFIPTVNSDKGLFDKLLCDLFAESHIPSGEINSITGESVGKRYIDLTDEEIIQELNIEFGPFYRNVITNIIKENDRLLKVLGVNYVHRTGNPAQAWKELLRAISDHFVYPEIIKTIKDPTILAYILLRPGLDLESDKVVREYITELWVNNSGMSVEELLNKYKTIEEVSDLAFLKLYGKFYGKIIDGIHETLTAYNKNHTRNPILLAEHIHYTKGSMGLAVNNSLVAKWGRFGATEEEIEEANVKDLYAKKSEYSKVYEILPNLAGKSIDKITSDELRLIEAIDPNLASSVKKAAYNMSQYTAEGYFKARDLESVIKLLKDGCQIYLYGNKARVLDETEFLKNLDGGKWVTKLGTMAFTRVEDAATHEMIPTNSMYTINEARRLGLNIEINPMISKLNKMDYLTTQQYVCCVGGADYVYKGKSGANVLEEEANRWLASNKRNVCYASTVHKFLNNLLNGAPSTYNYAIIEDIDAALYNINGELKSHTPIDGGMLVNPFMPDLENISLGGEAAGGDKKHFATFYFEQYGAGGITKTAGFAATNERMRNSYDWRILVENMTNRKWIKEFENENGNIYEELDITKDYDGNDINWQDKKVFYFREQEDGTIQFYRLSKLVKTENPNEYEIWELPIDEYGNDAASEATLRATEVIDTNWILFNDVFGGYNSLSHETTHGVENPNSKLVPSEKSIKLMVEAINRIGYRKTRENAYLAINKYGDPIIAYNTDRTKEDDLDNDLEDIWLPLKYSDVHFAPNIGAIKSTLMNVNPSEAMSERMDLNIMTVKMAQLGIQLDKEHHADLSELSMPTQIITACANRGFTLTKTSELYQALSNLTEMAIEDCMKGVMDALPEGENKGILQAKIAEIIVDKLIYSLDDNEALHAVMQHLEEKRLAGNKLTPEDVKGTIPWSDTMVYNKIYSDLATHLTNLAIKLKISGSLAVICPTHHIERLHGNKRLSSLIELVPGGAGEQLALQLYQQLIRENEYLFDRSKDNTATELDLLNRASKLDTQHIYNIEYIDPFTGQILTRTITINYPQLYWLIKNELLRAGKFKKVQPEELKGVWASASKDGFVRIVDASEIDPENFYHYIKGEPLKDGTISVTSRLKQIVFLQLNTLGYTEELLRSLLGDDPNKIRMFLMFHELSHLEHKDHESYPKKLMTHPETQEVREVNDLMHKDAIAIEARATKDAFDKMIEVISNGPKAQEYLAEITEINNIHENVIEGRELSAYNVRFKSVSTILDGVHNPARDFCMYDLDSLRLLYEVVNDVMPDKGPGIKDIKEFGKNKLATLEGIYDFLDSEPLLKALKSDIFRIYGATMAKKYPKIWEAYKKLNDLYKKIDALYNKDPNNELLKADRNKLYFLKTNFLRSREEFQETKVSPNEAVISSYKNALKTALKFAVQRDLFAISTDYLGDRQIMSQGKMYQVDPSSIKSIAYELIMPKIYKTVFGLKEHDDLLKILADKDFFAKRAMSKLKRTIADDNLYDYQLKRFSGDHLYILDSRKEIPSELRPSPNFHIFAELDGSYSRVDLNGDVIYALASKDDLVMIAPDGTEVIVTKNPEFYIQENIFNTATFSNSRVSLEELQLVIDNLKNTTSRNGSKFKRIFANKKGQILNFSGLRKRNLAFELLTEDSLTNTSSLELNNIIAEIYNEGRKVHTSFNKSLDIIAGRVPAQSQLSFMTLRVAAFIDSDVNAAYVSTFLLFILGSDLDIDTVNLIGAGFDKNGNYVLWSPYANLVSEELVTASEHLPFPTGRSTEITYDNSKDSFFVTYNDYFGRGKLFDIEIDPRTNEVLLNEAGVPVLSIDTENPEIINQLGLFLRLVNIEGLNLKGNSSAPGNWEYSRELDSEIYEQGVKFNDYSVFSQLNIKPSQLRDILLLVKLLVDEHNLYIKRVDKRTKELMAKNLAYYLMYSVAAEASNLTEGLESIDGPTSLIKGKGGAVEVAMSDEDKFDITSNNEKLSGPDPATKAYSLATGQIGKLGVSIGAKGTLGNSVVQFAIDKILNSDVSAEIKERILLPIAKDKKGNPKTKEVVINGKKETILLRGYFINGRWRSAVANIHDKTKEQTGISMQTSLDILGMLADLESKNEVPLNAATSIAAMLSVAVDRH